MRVILVDDEYEILEHLQYHIAKVTEIKEIKAFTDPYEALEYVKQQAVDVAFLDIEMNEMNGIELSKRINEIKPEVNIIFVTGHEQYALDAFRVYASDYLLKPTTVKRIQIALENLRIPIKVKEERVWIQTFGNFTVFINGKPLKISYLRAKELLAYLVDKRGASVTKAQIAAILWEDKEYSRSLQKMTQTVISQMMKILRDAEIDDIIIKNWNSFAVDVSKFECDYYQFLKGDISVINTYTGEYMNEYSWAEMTAGMLMNRR